jgi:hypothetical protein
LYSKHNRFGFITRYDWRIDCRPATNVDRRDVISQASEPAGHTAKLRLRRTIGFIHMTASWTGAACVSGIYQEHRYARSLSLIGYKGAQLVERPAMQGCPLRATNRNPLAYAFQILQGNRSICVFRFGNQLFADAVVSVFGKPVFFARPSFEFPFSRPCTFSLQFSPKPAVTMAHMVDVYP